MTKAALLASWTQLKVALKAENQKLTENDLHLVEGKEEDLYVRIQARLGKSYQEMNQALVGHKNSSLYKYTASRIIRNHNH